MQIKEIKTPEWNDCKPEKWVYISCLNQVKADIKEDLLKNLNGVSGNEVLKNFACYLLVLSVIDRLIEEKYKEV